MGSGTIAPIMATLVPDPPNVIGERLRDLRVAFGYERNQKGFAQLCGLSEQNWNNYERGRRRPLLDNAVLIRAATGVTLDWIYYGDRSGLSGAILERLNAAVAPAKKRA